MTMNEKNFGYLGTAFQQSLLKAIIEDKKFALTIIDVIDSKYFDGPYFKYIMENIKELHKTFGSIPNYETLTQKILSENKETSSKIHIDTLNAIKEKELEGDGRYVKSTSLNFCRQQVLKKALKESEEIMTNGDFENYDKIENKIRGALQVGAIVDDIEDISENVAGSLEDDCRLPFPTGIEGIDNLLKGGIARGEMAIFLAPTGIGKTTWLTKMANAAYGYGANVLHIFFEDNLVDIRRKHYTIWTGIPPDEQPFNREEVIQMVDDITVTHKNFLKLAKYPSGALTINDIRNKIRKLESEGHKVDLLVLDYIDCIASQGTLTGEEWKGEGTIMRSLEAMTDEFNIAIWTATQGNRDSIGADVVTTDQMGGSIKKAQVGHVVISAAKTLEQKEHNLANITLLKSRIGKDGVVFQNCKFDNEYLQFDTDTQNTLLGHAEEKAEKKKERAQEVYKASQITKSKIREQVESEVDKLIEKKNLIISELHELEHGNDMAMETFSENVSPPEIENTQVENVATSVAIEVETKVVIEEPPKIDESTEMTEEQKRLRAAQAFKERQSKLKEEQPKVVEPPGMTEEQKRLRAAQAFKERQLKLKQNGGTG